MKRRVLVADDSSTIQKVVKIAFSKYSVDILEAGSYIEALSEINQNTPQALIVDASLPGTKSPEDFAKLSKDAGNVPLILLVGSYENIDEDQFRVAGLRYFLKKPFESSDIVSLLGEALGTDIEPDDGSQTDLPAAIPNMTPTSTTIIPPPPGGGPAMPGPMDGASVPPVPPAPPNPVLTLEDDSVDMPIAPRGAPTPLPPGAATLSAPSGPPPGGADINLPPSPMTDIGLKGKKAFSLDDEEPTQGRKVPEGQTVPPIPPPVTADEDEISTSVAPVPPPPPKFSIKEMPDPIITGSKRPGDEVEMPQRPKMPTEIPIPPVKTETPDEVDFKPPTVGIPGGLDEELSEQMPSIIRKVVEDYCDRHFKSLAREIIATELRRLADEKARHLVDN